MSHREWIGRSADQRCACDLEDAMSSPGATYQSGSSDASQSEAMSAVLAQNWWALAIRGVAGIIFGLIALLMPGVTMISLVLLFSAYMLVDGVFAIVAAVRSAHQHERWWLLAIEGMVDIAAGVVAFLWPGVTVLAFVLLVATWAVVSGGLMFAAAFRLKIDHGRWWLGLGGAVSLVYGILLVLAPAAGALVLTLWLGAYALVFGVALLVLAFRLRSHRNDHPHVGIAQPA
jgi:uncharacterized membrane protein HdeD (DUF308 family)